MKRKILIAGGSGLVGSRLQSLLSPENYDIHILTRSPKPPKGNVRYFHWDLNHQEIDTEALKVDYIINLTGAGIADKRWTAERKRLLMESRTQSAALIKKGLTTLDDQPKMYIGASAIGYYGSRGEAIMKETAAPGEGFLSDTCSAWEDAHQLLTAHVGLHAMVRIGIVLSMDGGALPKMLMTKQVGIFNYFGDGKQYYSWIHIDDLCRMFIYIIDNELQGIYNGVAPTPYTNKAMMRDIIDHTELGGILVPAPAFALKLAMGEMSAVVLDSCNASAQKIKNSGFTFKFHTPAEAVSDLLGD